MSTPDLIIVEVPQPIQTIVVNVEGPQGPKGEPGITVSATPPPDPQENELWIEIT